MKGKRKSKFASLEIDIEIMANSIWALVQDYNRSHGFTKSCIKWSLDRTLRNTTSGYASLVSSKVADLFIENFPNQNPFEVRDENRYKFGEVFVNRKRKSKVLREHTTPVGELIIKITKSKSYQDVLDFLNEYSGVCVVTREEDDCLSQNGYCKKRPNGWKEAYDKCGIQVLSLSEFEEYKSREKKSNNQRPIPTFLVY